MISSKLWIFGPHILGLEYYNPWVMGSKKKTTERFLIYYREIGLIKEGYRLPLVAKKGLEVGDASL